jgi:hypothetical protein
MRHEQVNREAALIESSRLVEVSRYRKFGDRTVAAEASVGGCAGSGDNDDCY